MHDSITAHCILEKYKLRSFYTKKQTFLNENHQSILSLNYEKLERFSSTTLTVFEDIGLSSFDNFGQPPMFTIAFYEPYKSELIYF